MLIFTASDTYIAHNKMKVKIQNTMTDTFFELEALDEGFNVPPAEIEEGVADG